MRYQELQTHIEELGPRLAENGQAADAGDRFSYENYKMLRELKLFSAMVPEESGGGNLNYDEMTAIVRQLAGYHPSTALSFSMHQHIIAANRYNHMNGRPGKALLEKVAGAELILVSTGAGDWLASSGEMSKTDGGFLLTGIKHFASGSPAGNLLVTSAPYEDPQEGWQVLHFPVPLDAEGVTVLGNWSALGMRGTGSNSVQLDKVFVPEAAIAAKRPRGNYHLLWYVILPVALPLIMSAYLGIAETAAQRARERCVKQASSDPCVPYVLGEMENALTTASLAVESMVAITNNFQYQASQTTVNEIVKRKTIAAAACQQTATKALEACGGQGYLRPNGIESLFRDVLAAHFHPMQEQRQLLFTGSLALGQEPPGAAY